MRKVYTRRDCNDLLTNIRNQGNTIGFVPTMGALHEGHLSLIEYSNQQTDFTVTSIFVNPTQFNDETDYQKYPRTIDEDLEKLESVACDCVFIPSYDEMYTGEGRTDYDLGNLDKSMEGAFRPGHFQGVAMIVDRLFKIIRPDYAFFGEKDFQQLQVIKHLVKNLHYDVQIVSCPIIRENDGLAMSSRNRRLSPEQRQAAPGIYQSLKLAKEFAGKKPVEDVKSMVIEKVNQHPLLNVEYFEIVDEENLESVKHWESVHNLRGCIAVTTGDIRLIDNINISS